MNMVNMVNIGRVYRDGNLIFGAKKFFTPLLLAFLCSPMFILFTSGDFRAREMVVGRYLMNIMNIDEHVCLLKAIFTMSIRVGEHVVNIGEH